MIAGQLVVAYHGCDGTTRDLLVSGALARLTPSDNRYDWLGRGVYFFENDAERAMLFAQASAANPGKLYTKEPIVTPTVVGAVLRIGSWLDMTTQGGLREFRQAHEDLATAANAAGIRLPDNEPAGDDDADVILRQLDKAVFDLLHRKRGEQDEPAYDAVRGAFQQGEPIAPSSAFKVRSHVQIALVNPDCVVSWFLVPGDRLMTPQSFAQAQDRLAEAKATRRKPRRLAAASSKEKQAPR